MDWYRVRPSDARQQWPTVATEAATQVDALRKVIGDKPTIERVSSYWHGHINDPTSSKYVTTYWVTVCD